MTMHAGLRTFQAEPVPPESTQEAKSSTYAFGLLALSKCIVRLPPEVLEEELPRLKATFISVRTSDYVDWIVSLIEVSQALNDTSSLLVRESAAASIIAAQLVLRDEAHLFSLLDGLADDKKNLLTYLFDKHGARGIAVSNGTTGAERLHKEIRRLDTRTSTPPRVAGSSVITL
jgi:CLIP-associating protein 1/2